MSKIRGLAERPDLQFGDLRVSPSRRLVEGPLGSVHLQPLVMQALISLLDAEGNVVTRDQLFDDCWGDNLVGNESLNRVMARVRQIPADVAPGFLEIETIPRTGYRIGGEIVKSLATDAGVADRSFGTSALSRRTMIGSSIAVVAVSGIVAFRSVGLVRSNRQFDLLMQSAEIAVRDARFDEPTLRSLEQSVAIRPASAKAWGMLALVRSVRTQDPKVFAHNPSLVADAQEAAQRALSIERREPNAQLAMFELQGSALGWIERDRTLRQIIAIDNRHVFAMTELLSLLQAAGLNRESWQWTERALAISPLSADLLGRRALKLWIAGRIGDADKVIDQVRSLYPADPGGWWVQFLILALSERSKAARAMLMQEPAMLNGPLAELWDACLPALNERTSANVRTAMNACLRASRRAGELAAHSVMILASLDQVGAAFGVADGFLLWRGSVVRQGKSSVQSASDTAWRVGVQWLFTPPCANMRKDRRFLELCQGIGLTEYWRKRSVTPDFLRGETYRS